MNKGVIILGGHIQSLGIVRIFGRIGIPAVVIDNTSVNLSGHSKYCIALYKVPDEELLGFLMDLGSRNIYSGWIVFPTNDFHVSLLSFNKQDIEAYFQVSTDNWEVINIFYNKIETYKLASALNIPIADTYFPKNEESLNDIYVGFPCIIKPAIMHEFYKKTKKKVIVCQSREELMANYRKALAFIPAQEIIIQNVINGPSKNQFSACFLFLQGQPVVYLTACRMRQHPIDFGNATTYAETVDLQIIKSYAERILKAANYNGLCEVEFKLDDQDNQYKLLEINPRTWKWHSIANKAGTPFLKTYYEYLTGEKISPITTFKKASFYHFLTDFPVRLQLLFKGYSYWKRKERPVENAVWASDDPIPWFFEKLYLFYYILKR
jgi:D-aspartate ligase